MRQYLYNSSLYKRPRNDLLLRAVTTFALLSIAAPSSASCIDTDGDGWGWDGSNSCRVTVVQNNCNYDNAHLHGGWGWDPTTSQSCAPPVGLAIEYTWRDTGEPVSGVTNLRWREADLSGKTLSCVDTSSAVSSFKFDADGSGTHTYFSGGRAYETFGERTDSFNWFISESGAVTSPTALSGSALSLFGNPAVERSDGYWFLFPENDHTVSRYEHCSLEDGSALRATGGADHCIDTDPVGDGWGWDSVTSCRITETVQPGACIDTTPVGDGWGWDGVTSCRIAETVQPGECIDTPPVGDGWGWDGVTSCQIHTSPLRDPYLLPGDPGIVSDCSSFGTTTTAGTLAFALANSQEVDILCAETIIVPEITIDTRLQVYGGHLDGDAQNRVFKVEAGGSLSLLLTTVSGGYASQGAGIFNEGTLNMTQATITDNLVTQASAVITGQIEGAGVYNSGSMSGTGNAISNNLIDAPGSRGLGAGIYNTGNISMRQLTVSSNTTVGATGGGIYNSGDISLSESSIENNSIAGASVWYPGGFFNGGAPAGTIAVLEPSQGGGGVHNTATATFRMNRGKISNNNADASGAGILNEGTVFMDTVSVNNNTAVFPSVGGSAPIDGGNGGGISNSGTLNFVQGTVSGNSSGQLGGGIGNSGTADLANLTIESNSAIRGGGIYNSGGMIADVRLQKNDAAFGGAVANTGQLDLQASSITKNRATDFAAIWCDSYNATVIFVGTESDNVSSGFANGGSIKECDAP